jgi:hypothetical protein
MVSRPRNLDIRQLETRAWWVRWVVLHAVPYVTKSSRLENIQGSLQSGIPGSNSITRGVGWGLWWYGKQYHGTLLCWLHGRITSREYVDRLDNQVHSMSQTLFRTMQFSKTTMLHLHSWSCSVMVWRIWRWTSTSSPASTITRFDHDWPTPVSFGD